MIYQWVSFGFGFSGRHQPVESPVWVLKTQSVLVFTTAKTKNSHRMIVLKDRGKGIVQDKDVALCKYGACIGHSRYFRDGFPHADFRASEHVSLLRATGAQLVQNPLYPCLKESSTISAIRAANANAAQPGINLKGVEGLVPVTPSRETASRTDEMAGPYRAPTVSLVKRSNMLRQTRDLLLPQLVSGEPVVSELDTGIGEPA